MPGGTADAVTLPLPGLYNVYNALAAAALALALGASLRATSSPGSRPSRPAFGRAETLRLGDRDLTILLVKNPAGANEVLRTLDLEPGEHDLLGDPQRPHRRRQGRVAGSGTPTSSFSARGCAARRAAARARRSSRCG